MATEDKKYRFVKAPNYTGEEITKSVTVTGGMTYRTVSGVANQIRMNSYNFTVKNDNDYSLRINEIFMYVNTGSDKQLVSTFLSEKYSLSDLIIEAHSSKYYNGSLNNQILTFSSGGLNNLTGSGSSITFRYGDVIGEKTFTPKVTLATGQDM